MKRIISLLALLLEWGLPRTKRLSLSLVTITILFLTSAETTSADITELIPSSTIAGGPAFTLRIIGMNFAQSDEGLVLFNGTRVEATLITAGTPGELQATIPASLIVSPAIVEVTLEGFNSKSFTIVPATGCPTSLSPQEFMVDSGGGDKFINIYAPEGCSWTAISNAEWISLSVLDRSPGNGEVRVTISRNEGSFRAGTITIGNKQVSVYQDPGGCVATVICQFFPSVCAKKAALTVSRSFRDEVLADSPRGQLYTRLYYQFSSQAVQVMMLNPMLILRSREMMERYIPVIEAMVKGEQVTLTQSDLEEIDSFLKSFAAKGSPELQEAIKGLREDLRNPQVHKQFKITITEGPKREISLYSIHSIMQMSMMMLAPLALSFFCFYRRPASRENIESVLKGLGCVVILLSVIHGLCFVASAQGGMTALQNFSAKLEKNKAARPNETYNKLPLSFEANQGQADPQVAFTSRGPGYSLFLTATQAVMKLTGQKSGVRSQNDKLLQLRSDHRPLTTSVLRMKFIGANPHLLMRGLREIPGPANYFIGRDRAKWRANIPTYANVKYENVYKGVDLVYYGNHRELEYDFIVAPGANPAAIRLGFEGMDKIEIDSRGDLLVRFAGSEVRQRKPVAYQENNGERRAVACRYTVGDQVVRFAVGPYDQSKPLIIDPVLVYSTYFGGSGNDEGNSIAVDPAGNVYLTGFTDSTNFPLANSSQPDFGGGQQDAFVVKLDPSGTRVVYSTYFGGSSQDNGTSIAVDSAGNAYVTGFTDSPNFPVRSALQPTKRGGFNAFVAKLDQAGSILTSTLFGGSINDYGSSVAIDSSGNIYIAGIATSPDLSTANALQRDRGGLVDIYVAKIDPSANRLVYSTYLGGIGIEGASSIAVDQAGNVYLTGLTSSPNFRTVNAFQSAHGGGLFDAFVAKLNSSGSDVIYSTYLGGGGEDRAFRIAVDSAGSAYVTGDTDSTNFPLANAAQQSKGGIADAFVAKLNPSGNRLVYSTYLGGSGIDGGTAIAVDSAGSAYVTGFTGSPNFPTIAALQLGFGGGSFDAFVAKLNQAGSALDYSTYLGGGGIDSGFGIATDASGNAYVMGVTDSPDLPTAAPFQSTHGGGPADVFIAKVKSSGLTIDRAEIQGKHLFVFGAGFDSGAKILIDGEVHPKTLNDEQNPTGVLFGKKAGKKIAGGQTVTLQVRNPDGSLSNQLRFTRP